MSESSAASRNSTVPAPASHADMKKYWPLLRILVSSDSPGQTFSWLWLWAKVISSRWAKPVGLMTTFTFLSELTVNLSQMSPSATKLTLDGSDGSGESDAESDLAGDLRAGSPMLKV